MSLINGRKKIDEVQPGDRDYGILGIPPVDL